MIRKREGWQRAAIALAALVASCTPSPSAPEAKEARQEPPPIEVTLASLARGSVQRAVAATGSLFGEEQVTVAAKVGGRVEAVLHDVGDVLEPGALLARIEATDYELAVTERRRAYEQALARLGLDALPEEGFSIDALPAVERARLQAENARARFERGQILHKRTPPAVSDQDFADLSTAYEVARADERVAQLNAKAQLAEARALAAQIASAEQRLADTRLSVPHGERPNSNGNAPVVVEHYVVSARRVSVGDFVQVGAPLYELLDPDPLELRARLPEREIARVKLGQVARLKVDAYTETFEGRVARINPAVDVKTRTFEVEISVPNGDGRLRAGAFARVEILTNVEADVLLVPASSIVTFAGVHKVFVVADDKASERVVRLGQRVGDAIEVVQGLKGDEKLVPEPPAGLTSGTRVRAAGGSQ